MKWLLVAVVLFGGKDKLAKWAGVIRKAGPHAQ